MNTLIVRTLACLAFIAIVGILPSQAQTTAHRVALRVEGLTSEERDQLSTDLRQRGDLRISFACVPAGILILEPISPDRSADSVRAMAAAALIHRLPVQRRSEVALSLDEAEELCSAARNQ
jgi:hypothetical protein